MKQLLVLICILISIKTEAQNHYITKQLTIPSRPAPSYLMEWADFSHDGYKDFVSISEVSGNILLHKNINGNPDSVPQILGETSQQFYIVDWNDDGWDDIIFIESLPDSTSQKFRALINDHSGGFLPASDITGAPSSNWLPSGIIFTDLNGDNFPDMISDSTSSTTKGLHFMLNNGGTLSVSKYFVAFNPFNGFTCLDVDLNGNMDLALIHGQKIIVYQNIGSNNFVIADTAVFSNSGVFREVRALDLDNNGVKEIIGISGTDIYIASKTNNFHFDQFFTGSFLYQDVTSPVLTSFRGISDYSDIDANGFKDIVIANSVFYVNGLNITRGDIQSSPDFNNAWCKAVDSNNDNTMELWWIMHEYFLNGDASIYSANYTGANSFAPKVFRWNCYFVLTEYSHFLDFDNDGDYDYLYRSPGKLMMAINDGNNNFTDKILLNAVYEEINVFDYDNDGLPDLLCTTDATTDDIIYAHNNGNMNFQIMGNFLSNTPKILGFADFDNDGYKDILLLSTGSASIILSIIKNTGGTFQDMGNVQIISPVSYYGHKTFITDWNNDNLPDIYLFYGNQLMGQSGGISILQNTGNFSFNAIFNLSTSSNDGPVGFSDVNADGYEDILYQTFESNYNRDALRVFMNTGSSFNPSVYSGLFNNDCNNYFCTDANNDGLEDIIAFHTDGTYDFKVALNTSNGFTTFVHNGQLKIPNYSIKPQFIDYDHDGDTDFIDPKHFLIYENTSNSIYSITGNVFYDLNGNGQKDVNDVSVQQFPIGTSPQVGFVYTDSIGNYSIRMGGNAGNFSIHSLSEFNSSFNFTTVPYPGVATIADPDFTDTVDIGFNSPSGIQQVKLDMAISGQRCGWAARLWLNGTNFSPLSSNFSFKLTLPPQTSYVSSSISPTIQSGQTLEWNNISTIPFDQKQIWLDLIMPPAPFAGDTLYFIGQATSTQGTSIVNSYDTLAIVLTCSFDPNQKLFIPLNTQLFKDTLFAFDDYIEYQIDFQNTGTDSAMKVVIRDLISPQFDLSSIRLISSSHPVEFYITGNGELNAIFDGIMLPDSGTDFTGSMGYVKFSVTLNNGIPISENIINTARIYFDDNDPVITNTTLFKRARCSDFLVPQFNTAVKCELQEYVGYLNNHGLDAIYTWLINGVVIGSGATDSIVFTTPGLGTHTLQINVDLDVV